MYDQHTFPVHDQRGMTQGREAARSDELHKVNGGLQLLFFSKEAGVFSLVVRIVCRYAGVE